MCATAVILHLLSTSEYVKSVLHPCRWVQARAKTQHPLFLLTVGRK